MTFIRLISNNQVLETAIDILKRTKKSLHLTMIMKDELQNPSQKYIRLLQKKALEGINIKRIGFGSKSQFKLAVKQLNFPKIPSNGFFIRMNYKYRHRLLISDKTEMIFAIYTDDKTKMVFHTNSQIIIKNFLKYFKRINNY